MCDDGLQLFEKVVVTFMCKLLAGFHEFYRLIMKKLTSEPLLIISFTTAGQLFPFLIGRRKNPSTCTCTEAAF
jgi:hypothetical protein